MKRKDDDASTHCDCLDASAIEAYAASRLDPSRQRAAEEHLAACERCATEARRAAEEEGMARLLREARREVPIELERRLTERALGALEGGGAR